MGFTASQIHEIGYDSREKTHYEILHNIFTLPILFNVVSNPFGNSHFESDFGLVLTHTSDPWHGDDDELGIAFSMKYRYQGNKIKGLFFSIGPTPTLYPKSIRRLSIGSLCLAFAGVSLGYHF